MASRASFAEPLDGLLRSFALTLRTEGKSERTVTIYRLGVEHFSGWLASHGQPADLSGLTRDNVRGWLDSLRARGLSDGSVLTHWRGVRRFTGWALSEKIIRKDPLAGITVDRPEAPAVAVFPDEELAALIGACKGSAFTDRRDEAIIRLLMDCGLRVGELVGIDCKDLDLDTQQVPITGKGDRARMAYFGSKTALAIDRYLRARRGHRHAGDPALLLGERGRLSPDGVRERLKIRADRAGLDPKLVHPHRFRHTAAHDWLMAGGQERDLMRLLGWRSEAMLSRYGASAADVRARQAARRLSRGDRV